MTAWPDDSEEADAGTTHDREVGGRPRLIFSMGGHAVTPDGTTTLEQGAVELTRDVTTVGSAADADLRLTGIDLQHGEIVHDEFDEYVFIQLSKQATTTVNGERMGRRPLRTGDRLELGPWMLSYFREEYVDHGRPFGGRRGGEAAVHADLQRPTTSTTNPPEEPRNAQ